MYFENSSKHGKSLQRRRKDNQVLNLTYLYIVIYSFGGKIWRYGKILPINKKVVKVIY